MNSSRQEVMWQLEKMSNQLNSYQLEVLKHKNYLSCITENKILTFTAAFFTLYAGWKIAKAGNLGKFLMQFVKVKSISYFSDFTNNILRIK